MILSNPHVRRALVLVGIAILSTVAARIMVATLFSDSSLFYLLLPYLMSLSIYWTAPKTAQASFARQTFTRHFAEAMMVFVLVAAFMLEGFLCVLFSAPIYVIDVALGYLTSYSISGLKHRRRHRVNAYALPALAAILSLEGVSAATTLDRENRATYETTVAAGIAELKANLAKPIAFDRPRQWFIALFPAPVRVEAGSLNPGDIHKVSFVYRKWIVTNAKEGELLLRIDSVGDDGVETTVVANDSYLAAYMTIEGTRIRFEELGPGRTRVSLTLFYRRNLDPVWYFGPLQRFAMNESARHLVDTVIARMQTDG